MVDVTSPSPLQRMRVVAMVSSRDMELEGDGAVARREVSMIENMVCSILSGN